MDKLFGTDGIRGIANRHPVTAELALKVGRAVAYYFKGRGGRVDKTSIILIGKDTRRSSYMIEQALAAGVTSQGAFAMLVGPMPTPGVAYLAKSMRADAGIVVSASHNTYEYNGIKLFGHDGFKLDENIEEEIERLIQSNELENSVPTGAGLGRAKRIDDALGRYIVYVKSAFPSGLDLSGFKIVLDSANGAAYKAAPFVLEELAAEVIQIGNQPNGVNINMACGALHPEAVTKLVLEQKANLGIALDGDADRVILVDEKGEIVDGDQILAMLAVDFKESGTLAKNTVVVTSMSNMGFHRALSKAGIKVESAKVGDRYVMDLMRKNGVVLGGEQSGHIIHLDYGSTGDGMVAALLVLSLMKRKQKPLSELKKVMKIYPQIMRNVRVTSKPPLETLANFQSSLKNAEKTLGAEGRIVVRYSGTEPVCRIMIEGEDRTQIQNFASQLEVELIKDLGSSH